MNLIVLMAGSGSRFVTQGYAHPKPLIALQDRPFFWWAVESARSLTEYSHLVFVVLRRHVIDDRIDQIILEYYPTAKIVILEKLTRGAAETAYLGIQNLPSSDPVIFLDCDHAFDFEADSKDLMISGGAFGVLFTFESNNPGYSYLKFNSHSKLVGTAEKSLVSNKAIAGIYYFQSVNIFISTYLSYIDECNYSELYLSGLYNILADNGYLIQSIGLKRHVSFGTPDEFNNLSSNDLCLNWTSTSSR